MKYDYAFFENSLERLRRLKSYSYDKSYLLDAPQRLFPEQDFGMAPRVLETRANEEEVILTRSYARKPGDGVESLEKKLQNRLPEDFRQFYELYNEALITTRTHPIHLWSVEKIIEGIDFWRDVDAYPLRFFRFGDYWNRDSLYFGLWQPETKSQDWYVAITEWGDRDQDYDEVISSEYILASSFCDWLKKLIETDGLPDPYMEIGLEGGFLDPA